MSEEKLPGAENNPDDSSMKKFQGFELPQDVATLERFQEHMRHEVAGHLLGTLLQTKDNVCEQLAPQLQVEWEQCEQISRNVWAAFDNITAFQGMLKVMALDDNFASWVSQKWIDIREAMADGDLFKLIAAFEDLIEESDTGKIEALVDEMEGKVIAEGNKLNIMRKELGGLVEDALARAHTADLKLRELTAAEGGVQELQTGLAEAHQELKVADHELTAARDMHWIWYILGNKLARVGQGKKKVAAARKKVKGEDAAVTKAKEALAVLRAGYEAARELCDDAKRLEFQQKRAVEHLDASMLQFRKSIDMQNAYLAALRNQIVGEVFAAIRIIAVVVRTYLDTEPDIGEAFEHYAALIENPEIERLRAAREVLTEEIEQLEHELNLITLAGQQQLVNPAFKVEIKLGRIHPETGQRDLSSAREEAIRLLEEKRRKLAELTVFHTTAENESQAQGRLADREANKRAMRIENLSTIVDGFSAMFSFLLNVGDKTFLLIRNSILQRRADIQASQVHAARMQVKFREEMLNPSGRLLSIDESGGEIRYVDVQEDTGESSGNEPETETETE